MTDLLAMTDEEISALISVRKTISNPSARWSTQSKSRQKTFKAKGDDGSEFIIYLRQSEMLDDCFSCGIRINGKDGSWITLKRYNGSDHVHENPLEGFQRIEDSCHIHTATHRYIHSQYKPDHYAEETNRYDSIEGAFKALCDDCNVENPSGRRGRDQLTGELPGV